MNAVVAARPHFLVIARRSAKRDEAIQSAYKGLDCFASLAMTTLRNRRERISSRAILERLGQ
jgi:hypothetical protein